ncbi:MAG: methyltransferase domain-containing protein [Bdellovibrionia bacterium]
MKNSGMAIWQLRKGMDRRFRAGHPWVYSNELTVSPKGIEPGAPVELRDHTGKFLARGYGNPNSLISFRALSRNSDIADPTSTSSLVESLRLAGNLRGVVGLRELSHRLCFGEADGLPGLIIDRYKIGDGQVFIVQAHSAGANRWIPHIEEILEKYVRGSEDVTPAKKNQALWDSTSIVIRNDLSVRKLEGINEEEPRILRKAKGIDLKDSVISVAAALGGDPVLFHVDLVGGQKTGFFLDQAANIELAALRLRSLGKTKVRILDLCCYVGQWGTQLARVFRNAGLKVEVVAVDASNTALEFAKQNIQAQGVECETFKADVLRDLPQLPDRSFDIVISDPPALIKNRKDIPTGTHAYLQLKTQAFRLVKAGGGIVCCSCSSLLEEESFAQVLAKAGQRNGRTTRWIGRGGQSADHPFLPEFPEGRYLKGWVGWVNG